MKRLLLICCVSFYSLPILADNSFNEIWQEYMNATKPVPDDVRNEGLWGGTLIDAKGGLLYGSCLAFYRRDSFAYAVPDWTQEEGCLGLTAEQAKAKFDQMSGLIDSVYDYLRQPTDSQAQYYGFIYHLGKLGKLKVARSAEGTLYYISLSCNAASDGMGGYCKFNGQWYESGSVMAVAKYEAKQL